MSTSTTAPAAAAAAAAEAPKGTLKRDQLRTIEHDMQAVWDAEHIHEIDAPQPDEEHIDKWMTTFPFPYMNGRLHLGHLFSLTKCDFMTGYQRLKGKRAIFPFGFHVTGMPIKACADKLIREIELFGTQFERYTPEEDSVAEAPASGSASPAAQQAGVAATPAPKLKAKQAQKGTGLKYQFQIMESMGVPREEIHKFADPKHWIYFFPPLAEMDLKDFGARIDWRRKFFTTDNNLYYDSFIRWQFNQLRASQTTKIAFGDRYTIYSPKDGQPCMDHDRSAGEGVGVQEYTGIKIRIKVDAIQPQQVGPYEVGKALLALGDVVQSKPVFLIAATLRPETMYGQTSCFVGTTLTYGLYETAKGEIYVCSERAARNMAWQDVFGLGKGQMKQVATLKGTELVGLPLSAPLSCYDTVYSLPMENVLATKGTAVVTSVPSDSPDDHITMQDLRKKSAYYNVLPEWVNDFAATPIIDTPEYGNLVGPKVCEILKIQSQKDKALLAEAKERAYKAGFYNGTMVVGDHKGLPVQEAKPLIRQELIDAGHAFVYCEPEGLVVSRSGDDCVVTLTEQWYMNYGEAEWKAQAVKCLSQMELYMPETRNAFEKTLDWLHQWAVSRTYGLGSKLPWDKDWLIESLSDSTIYMAYYTVSHFLHQGSLDGSTRGKANIAPEQMTDAVWSYIFRTEAPFPADTTIPRETLDMMKREFNYLYPLDLRCSGKDLINNHLTFSIYNHVALFPEKHWPRGFRCNGHLTINNEKMSKSTGNFMTVEQAMERYGADATRLALADAGDSLEDANFLDKTADESILKLHALIEFTTDVSAGLDTYRTGELTWHDRLFMAQMADLVDQADKAYAAMAFREALKISWFDLQNARNEYRKVTTGHGSAILQDPNERFDGYHKDVILHYLRTQVLLLAPITPHVCDYLWRTVLKQEGTVMGGMGVTKAYWPAFAPTDKDAAILAAGNFLLNFLGTVRATEDANVKKAKKKGGAATPAPAASANANAITIYVAKSFPQWQTDALAILESTYDVATGAFNGQEKQAIAKAGLMKDKRVMPYVATMKQAVMQRGPVVFRQQILFDEHAIFTENLEFIRRDLVTSKVAKVTVLIKEDLDMAALPAAEARKADMAIPGTPTYILQPLEA
ncbi:hypothetical protein CXG81DRAFT_9001 [Caulochytrium protostelioides]|uniref:leucine--tRNA ligase n=1 Tax=Caulochytrium protostelioides TaxID=1555241 RepID=A0A4P9WYA8_9FUNG|nr:leucyl-tRNA synthetase [Caulochytrium protostelioides]RKP03853.1 hypothetical protein CXG81DRAFT_9001 [Caulochytrium protostelioides]|eukprot:RKP03853.1 hypothetical protein CXG81DRAFT_9001 [Caulochytrium protostelioides]